LSRWAAALSTWETTLSPGGTTASSTCKAVSLTSGRKTSSTGWMTVLSTLDNKTSSPFRTLSPITRDRWCALNGVCKSLNNGVAYNVSIILNKVSEQGVYSSPMVTSRQSGLPRSSRQGTLGSVSIIIYDAFEGHLPSKLNSSLRLKEHKYVRPKFPITAYC
jgi:hypothetical protein